MVKLSDIDLPMIFENRLLFSHGFHNNLNILPEEVSKSLGNTNWTDQRNRSLFFSHHNRDAQKWVGRVNNPRVVNGELYGDLEIHDADLALKIGPGKAPIGVSAEIRWPMQYPNPTDFSYNGFAMVPNPEVPETMLNFSKAKEEGFNSATLHTPFTNESTTFSEEVVEVTEEVAESTKEEVADERVGEVESISVESEEAKDEKAEVEDDTDNSNLMGAERGLNKKMENNAKKVEDEVKETVEEVVEVKEEAKADFSKFEAKIDALEAKIGSLTEAFAKFSETAEAEEEEEVKEEVKEEVVEAKEDVVAEVEVEEVKEEVEEVVEEVKEEAKADFSQALAEKIDKLADAISKKEAAPMSTAEFGNKGINKEDAVIDRLTKSLSK